MPQTQDIDENVEPVNDFTPITADMHVSAIERTESAIVGPIATDRRTLWPLAPWRMVLVVVALLTAAVCGPPAADPATGFNGADLGVLISLAIFAAAFAPREEVVSQSLDVITALVAEGIRKQMAADKRRYVAPRDRREIAGNAAAVAIAVLVDVTGGHDHIVRAEGDTFTLQHPLAERLTGDLFECDVHAHIAAGEPLERGRYKVVATDSQSFDLIPVKDQP